MIYLMCKRIYLYDMCAFRLLTYDILKIRAYILTYFTSIKK